MNLGDEVDMEVQGAIYEKKDMIHVRMDAWTNILSVESKSAQMQRYIRFI